MQKLLSLILLPLSVFCQEEPDIVLSYKTEYLKDSLTISKHLYSKKLNILHISYKARFNPAGKIIDLYIAHHDSLDRECLVYWIDNDGIIIFKTEYNDAGEITYEYEEWSEEKWIEATRYFYNSNNQLILKADSHYIKNELDLDSIFYYYDDSDNLIKKEYRAISVDDHGKTTFFNKGADSMIYQNDKVVKMKTQYGGIVFYKYDSKDRLIKEIDLYGSGDTNRITETVYHNSDGKTKQSMLKLKYTETGKEILKFEEYNKIGKIIFKNELNFREERIISKFQYNADNKLIKQIDFYPDSGKKIILEYVYQ